MKIAFLNQPMDMLVPPHQNSIAIWTYKTAPYVAEVHDVVVYIKRSAAQQSFDGQPGVSYEFVPPVAPNRALMCSLDAALSRVRDNPPPAWASRLSYLDYAAQIAVKARRAGVDVVQIHNFTQFVPTVRAVNPEAKFLLHMNCEWLNQLDYDVMNRRLDQTDLVFGSSDYITDKVMDRFPHHADRCRTVYNGVDHEKFCPADDLLPRDDDAPLRLLFVGRVSPEKGVHDLIDAFTIVAAKIPNVQLGIAGPIGSLPREFIVDISEDEAVAGLARFYEEDYGALVERMVPAELKDRVNLLEAMAREKPVIATRVGGMVGIVGDEQVGTLVDRGDVEGLAAELVSLLTDEARRREIGAAGRQRVLDRFSWSQVARGLLREYEGLDVAA